MSALKNNKELQVAAIENGTVIDHIPPTELFKVATLLELDKMEATITTKGAIFRAEDVSQDIFDCIDIVADKLQSQMSKYKGKMLKKHKSNDSVRFELIPEIEEEHEEGKVVKTKKFQLAPMTVDEAILQMELLQHNFFVFLNLETDSVNVVYKRQDDNYGLLETTY